MNTPSRWGTQAPFSNITLDWTVPSDLARLPAVVGGKEMDFTYGDCKAEMDMVNRAFIETMIEGDANGRGFQYPIPTYSITRDFDWSDTENNRLLFEMTAKYGTPYFQTISTPTWSLLMSAACAAGSVWTCASCARKQAASLAQEKARGVWGLSQSICRASRILRQMRRILQKA